MTTNTFDQRWQQIGAVWRNSILEYRVLLIAALLVAGLFLFGDGDYLRELFLHSLSIALVVLLLDRLSERRADASLKKRLLYEMRHGSNDAAKLAVGWVRDEEWLTGESSFLADETLRNANLSRVNLSGANLASSRLNRTDLSRARLITANLSSAMMGGANLERANLLKANLTRAHLGGANLRGASLIHANLEDGHLRWAKLQGANLANTNLVGQIFLRSASFDTNTVLPDAKRQYENGFAIRDEEHGRCVYTHYWTPETDMSRYTDPQHPDFWQPKWAAAGFTSRSQWHGQNKPEPWREAGYGDDHMAWVRDHQARPWREAGYGDDYTRWVLAGKPEHTDSWQSEWVTLGLNKKAEWRQIGFPQPWREAGYGDDHMAWVRDGKPARKPGSADKA